MTIFFVLMCAEWLTPKNTCWFICSAIKSSLDCRACTSCSIFSLTTSSCHAIEVTLQCLQFNLMLNISSHACLEDEREGN